MPSVFLDLFTIRRFESMEELMALVGVKRNGVAQPAEYVRGIVAKLEAAACSQGETAPICPFWHFNTRKAVEMWPKEVYREREMMPLASNLKFGCVPWFM
jgi:hypothetical protein